MNPQPISQPNAQQDPALVAMRSVALHQYLDQHLAMARRVADELLPAVGHIGQIICDSMGAGGKLLSFGNGGSAADAIHLAEEMTGKFLRARRPLAAVALCCDGPALTCIANDFGYAEVFARQVTALARRGDVVIGISTSGNSENVLRGIAAAREAGAVTVGLLGRDGGKLAPLVDHAIIVPCNVTSTIQEMHAIIIHLWCDIVDRWAAGSVV